MNKPTLAAVGAFVVLLLAFIATREQEVSVGVQKFDAPSLSTAAIESIVVSGPNAARLERSANGWTVADPAKPDTKFPADDTQVQSLLTALVEFKAPDFVTDKDSKHAEYEVDAAKGTTVATTAAGKTFTMVLGKSSKSGGAYVRKADGTAVFASPSPVSGMVKRDVGAWRKKTITTAPFADVTQLDVARADGEAFTLKSEGGAWTLTAAKNVFGDVLGDASGLGGLRKLPRPFRFDSNVGQRLVTQLTSLQAQGFLAADADFSKAHLFTLTLKDGKTVKVSLAPTKRDDGTFALKVDGDAQQYAVASWVAEQLDTKIEGLRDLSLVAFDPSKATKLSITAAGKKTIAALEGGAWKLVEPKTAPAGVEFDGNQVVAQLNRLRGLRASKVVAVGVAKAGLATPSALIEVVVDGKPLKVAFGADTGSNSEVYVEGAIDDAVYAIPGSEKATWSTGAQLFNKPPPPPDLGQMQGLDQLPPEIRQKLMEQLRQQRN
ncbi:MAG: DUF4340 domain-containing protein [Myxococcales bacterium]|nr:DUF4340 domain-containing protein [Myxococcales bacterium]